MSDYANVSRFWPGKEDCGFGTVWKMCTMVPILVQKPQSFFVTNVCRPSKLRWCLSAEVGRFIIRRLLVVGVCFQLSFPESSDCVNIGSRYRYSYSFSNCRFNWWFLWFRNDWSQIVNRHKPRSHIYNYIIGLNRQTNLGLQDYSPFLFFFDFVSDWRLKR